jgi:p-aminobenzoyl-glutamate transporter AbgT
MPNTTTSEKGRIERLLGVIERVGNKLPDPAILFFIFSLFH